MLFSTRLMRLIYVTLVMTLSTQAYSSSTISTQQKIFGLSHFWREVTYNFGHWQHVPDLDWDKAYQQALPTIMATQSDLAYYREMQRFCALLKDGHTNIYLPEDLKRNVLGRLPMTLVELQHRAIVDNIAANLAKKVPIGSELLSIDGVPVATLVEQHIIPLISTSAPHKYWDMAVTSQRNHGLGLLVGERNRQVALGFVTPGGDHITIDSQYLPEDQQISWAEPLRDKPLMEFRMMANGVVYIALNYFSRPEIVEAFKSKLSILQKASGIILDLRRNGGGSGSIAAEILAHFTEQPFYGTAWQTPKHIAAYRAWGSVRDEYKDFHSLRAIHQESATLRTPAAGQKLKAPTMVLIGKHTASAAEDFLIMADNIPHILFVGEPTHGSTGQPYYFSLPGGGRARVSTKHDTYPDGREYIGVGIQPDVLVRPSLTNIREGDDPVLSEALRQLAIPLPVY